MSRDMMLKILEKLQKVRTALNVLAESSGASIEFTPATVTIAQSQSATIQNEESSVVGVTGNTYIINLHLKAIDTVATGERAICSLSVAPKYPIGGSILKGNTTTVAGAFYVTTAGIVYFNPTSQLSANDEIFFNAVGVKA